MPNSTPTLSLIHITSPPRVAPPAGGKPPLLLLVHGVGSNEQDLIGLAPYLNDRFFIVSVRAPLRHGDGYGWYPIQFTETGITADESQAVASRELLMRFLGEVVAAYDVDPDSIYLAGFSQGAIMSLFLSLHSPESVTAVVAMSGRLLPLALSERASDERLSGLPILAVHGLYDNVLPITEGRRIQTELSRLPVDLTYEEFPMGHEVPAESLAAVDRFLTARLDSGKIGSREGRSTSTANIYPTS